jgi:hypothetical protein
VVGTTTADPFRKCGHVLSDLFVDGLNLILSVKTIVILSNYVHLVVKIKRASLSRAPLTRNRSNDIDHLRLHVVPAHCDYIARHGCAH